jgi:hypothetical protein
MECVAYDHEFVAEMGRRHDEWSSPAAVAARARGKLQRPAAKGKGKRVQKARRPRRGSDIETDSASAFEPESEDEKSDDASADVRPRRQKKSLPAPQSPHNLSLDGELSDLTDLEE